MRKNSPQHQTPKAPEKASSPRLTLRFQPIRPKDERHGESSKTASVSSSDPRYQSYCVTMETRENCYDSSEMSSTSRTCNSEATDAQLNVVSSSKEDEIMEAKIENEAQTHLMSSQNENESSIKTEEIEDNENEHLRRKRRRGSKDSNDSKHSSSSLNRKKRNAASESDTQSGDENFHSELMINSHHRLSPKVPPLKIVIPTTSILEPDKDRCRTNSTKQNLPYVVTTSSDSCDAKSESSDNGDKENNKDEQRKENTEEKYQRVTRSSQRMAAALASANASTLHGHNSSSDSYESNKLNSTDTSFEEQTDIHPRKRKLRAKDGQSSTTASTSQQEDLTVINNYEMYLNIKKQVDKRRQLLCIKIQPKAPQGFKDYLMIRRTYVLAGNAASRLSVPMIPPPQSLHGSMKELFVIQEKDRYRLRLQQLIEKEKLVLTVEQEVVRVHGRAARAMQNQSIPFSVCTILKDEEIYNQIEPEPVPEDKERNARSRYNGRLFLSWLQDVDDKWEKVKDSMILRHHNEAESLHAVQKLDWEWKMKESGACDLKSKPIIDDISVPMIHVASEWNLLP